MAETDRRQIHIALWAGQWMLAATWFLLGLAKLLLPAADLQLGLGLVPRAPHGILRVVGLVELVGSLGLVLPAATAVLPRLTPIAAGCLAGEALLGAVVPGSAAALGLVAPNLALLAAAAVVTFGRIAVAPIAPFGLRESTRIDRALAGTLLDFAERHFARGVTRQGEEPSDLSVA